MKKVLAIGIVLSMLFGIFSTTAQAAEMEYDSTQNFDTTQQELDAIFTELNEMAAEEKMANILAQQNKGMDITGSNIKSQNTLRKQELENRLEELGVNTIDSRNSADMAALKEVMHGNNNSSVRSITDPPNLEAFADSYTLQQYTGNLNVDGTSYRYSYIYVTDNKGYSGSPLTHSQTTNILVGKESTLLKDIIDYQFSFGFSSYLGAIPGGWVADWAIGTVCAALESLDENSIISYTGNNNIYNMSMLSVTQMMYVYVYIPNADTWVLCGTRAPNISYARAEYVIANVAGTAVSDTKNYPTVSSSTGSYPYNYVRTYLSDGYHDIDYIGSFTVNAYDNRTIRFTPGFAAYPLHLT